MTEQPAELPEAAYEMVASRRGLIMSFGKLTEHEGRVNELPLRPENFRPMVGTYSQIAAEAGRRNAAQERSGFLDYLYFPEPKGQTLDTEDERIAVDEALKAYENKGAAK